MNRRDRGSTSLVELLVCVGLFSLIMALAIPALAPTGKIAAGLSNTMEAQRRERELMDPLIRFMRTTRPVARCRDLATGTTSYTTAPQDCTQRLNKRVEEVGTPFTVATANRICFFGFINARTASGANISAPDQICLDGTSADAVTVTTYPASSTNQASYTTCAPATPGTGCWTATPRTQRFKSGTTLLIDYFNAAGASVAPAVATATSNVRIITFAITAKGSSAAAATARGETFNYTVALRGTNYAVNATPGAPFGN